jgi:hypothetical protein
MKELVRLVKISTKGHLLLDATHAVDRHASQLAHFLREHRGVDEVAAADRLGLDPHGTQFRLVKRRLYSASVNALLFANVEREGNARSPEGRLGLAFRNLHVATSGRLTQHPDVAKELLVDALKIGLQVEHARLVVEAAHLLQELAAAQRGRTEDLDYYTAVYQQYRKHVSIIRDCRSAIIRVSQLQSDGCDRAGVVAYVDGILSWLSSSIDGPEDVALSSKIALARSCFLCLKCNMLGRYGRVIAIGSDLIGSGHIPDLYLEPVRCELMSQLALAYLCRGRDVEVVEIVDRLFENKSFLLPNVYRAVLAIIACAFRNTEYVLAYTLLRGLDVRQAQLLTGIDQERLTVYWAYVHLLVESRRLVREPGDERKFRVSRFRNSFGEMHKDKSFGNAQVIIIQLLHQLIGQHRGDQALNAETVERYVYRYLSGGKVARTKLFLRLLLELLRQPSARLRSTVKTDLIFKRLVALPAAPHYAATAEVIAYEELWSLLLEHASVRNK